MLGPTGRVHGPATTSMPSALTSSTSIDRLTFIDTNVLVYAHSATETLKQPVAQAALERLWAERSGVLSTQILEEFYVVATGKLRPAMHPSEAREVVELYATW